MTDLEQRCLAQLQPYTPYPTQNVEECHAGALHDFYRAQRAEYLLKHRPTPEPTRSTPMEPEVIPDPPPPVLARVTRQAMFHKILSTAALVTGVTVKAVKGKQRNQRVILARRLFYHYARETTGAPLETIAKTVGVDHSTVHHGIKLLKSRPEFHRMLIEAMDKIFGAARENQRLVKAEIESAKAEIKRLKGNLVGLKS